jgi:hypothetical protein
MSQGWTKGINCYSWSLGPNFHPLEKAKVIADCLERQFTPHDRCEEKNERQVEARVQDLYEAVDNDPHERIRPIDLTIVNKFPETERGLRN